MHVRGDGPDVCAPGGDFYADACPGGSSSGCTLAEIPKEERTTSVLLFLRKGKKNTPQEQKTCKYFVYINASCINSYSVEYRVQHSFLNYSA